MIGIWLLCIATICLVFGSIGLGMWLGCQRAKKRINRTNKALSLSMGNTENLARIIETSLETTKSE